MVPTLFHVGSWGVPAHEFFIGLGVVAAVFVYYRRARDTGALNEQIVWVAIGALVTGGIFAHISSAWRFAFTVDNSLVELWLHGGRSVLGGLAGAYLGAVVTNASLDTAAAPVTSSHRLSPSAWRSVASAAS